MKGKGMKKKGRGKDDKKSSKRLMSVVMAGIIVSAAMMAFVPLATAAVTNFVITPANNLAGATSAYTIQVNTTGFTSLDIIIPARFKAVTPPGGALIARADLWWNTPSPGTHYGYVTFTANATDPSNKVDVFADIGGGTATLRGMAVNYAEGATTSIKSPFGTNPERASLTLPTAAAIGSLSLHDLPDTITNVTVSIGEYVKNPTTGDYTFVADGVSETVHIRAPAPPVPVPEFNIFGLLALVAILAVAIAFATLRRKK